MTIACRNDGQRHALSSVLTGEEDLRDCGSLLGLCAGPVAPQQSTPPGESENLLLEPILSPYVIPLVSSFHFGFPLSLYNHYWGFTYS